MKIGEAIKRYRVKPGEKVDLAAYDPGDSSLFTNGGKVESQSVFDELRDELQAQQKVLYAQNKHRILIVLQAMDTGGKDGCVKHVFSRVDPQGVHVKAFKKPSEEELAHDFLWRVHPHVPGNGQIVIFNRSHYEDILAVRVKKLFGDEVWKRRYRHVIEFERMLAEEGTTIIKMFLHISKDEQKRRLDSRLANPAKHWKFNPDDLSDRARFKVFVEGDFGCAGRRAKCKPRRNLNRILRHHDRFNAPLHAENVWYSRRRFQKRDDLWIQAGWCESSNAANLRR